MPINGLYRRWISAGAGLAFLMIGMAWPCHALVITPARTELFLVPGTSAQMTLTATNDDKEKILVDLSQKDWFIPENNKQWTVDKWMELHGPPQFYLAPGESKTVDVTLRCPATMTGEVVGMASFLYRGEQPSMVTPMISVSLYLIAAGTEKISGQVADVIVRKWQDQVNISAKVMATGNIHLRPSGRLVITDSKGKKEWGSAPIPEGQPTYPGRDGLYSASLPAEIKLSPGRYLAKVELAYRHLELKRSQAFRVLSNGQIQMGAMK